jgi:hypothetical protein
MGEPINRKLRCGQHKAAPTGCLGGLFVFLAAVLWLSQRTERASAVPWRYADHPSTANLDQHARRGGRAFSDTIEKRVWAIRSR